MVDQFSAFGGEISEKELERWINRNGNLACGIEMNLGFELTGRPSPDMHRKLTTSTLTSS